MASLSFCNRLQSKIDKLVFFSPGGVCMSQYSGKRATLGEVAVLAGVSRSAVSRAFTEGASVSLKTRSKVERAALELGYRPNVLARSLTTRKTGLVGLVANNFHNPIFLEVFDLFTRQLQTVGLRPLIVNLTEETEAHRSVQLLLEYQVDAVVVASSTLPVGFADSFAEAGIPVVHAFGRPTKRRDINVIGIDNVEAGRLAARRLIACGYGEVGFLGGPEKATSTRDRLEGFLDVLNDHPKVKTRVHFAGDYTFEAGFDEMASMILRGLGEAYFCADDVISIGAMSALHRADYKIPEQIGIIGFNDMEMAGWDNVRLTTIRQPLDQIIEESVLCLEQILSSEQSKGSKQKLLPCHIVERDTLPPVS
jgi:DNA-binding LacI/PurR family transcriptional regulator